MAFLTFWIMIFGHSRACRIFYGSKIGQPTSAKAKTHLDPFPKSFPPLQMSISKFIEKNQFFGNFTKTAIFGQVLFLLFLLRFGVPRCCFFKSMISQLSFAQKIIKKALLDQKLCQFEFLLWPIYLVIFNLAIVVWRKWPVNILTVGLPDPSQQLDGHFDTL